MATSIGEIEATIRLRDDMTAQLRTALKQVGDLDTQLQLFGQTARSVGLGLTAALTVPISLIGREVVRLGMETIESENLFSVSFGRMADAARRWSEETSDALGLNSFELRQQSALIFNMVDSMGLGEQAAFDMATGITELANDMASFFDLRPEEAFDKLRSGIVGETEPLRRLGILVDDATTKTTAYRLGIAELGAELTQQQKVAARWQAILEQTTNAQGDLARTLDSPSNQLKRLKAEMNEAARTLGVELMPLLSEFLRALLDLVPAVQGFVRWFSDLSPESKKWAVALTGLVALLGPMLTIVGQLVLTLGPLVTWLARATAGTLGLSAAQQTATGTTLAFRGALGSLGLAAVSLGAGFLLAKRDMDQWLATQAQAKRAADEWERLKRDGTADPEFLKLFTGTAFKPLDEAVNIGALTGGLSIQTPQERGSDRPTPSPVAQLTKEIKDLADELSGRNVRERIRDLDAAIRQVGGSAQINASALADVAEELAGLEQRGGRLTPALQAIVTQFRSLDDVNLDVSSSLQSVNRHFADMGPSIDVAKRQVDEIRAKMASLTVIDPLAFLARINSIPSVELDEAPKRLREVWIDALDSIGDGFERLATIGGDIFSGIARGFGLGIAGAADFLTGLNDIAKGGLQNVLSGVGSLVGALTAGVQAAIALGQALGDAFTRSEAEKAAADIRGTLGLDASEDDPIVQAIEDLVKSGVVRNRNEAIALNLDELLAQAGGATAANFDTFLGRSVELFDLLDRGGQVGAMALESLDAILGDLGRHVVEQGGLWDEHFVAVLQRAQAEGRALASVTQLLQGEMSKVGKGIQAITRGFLAGLPTATADSAMSAVFGSPEDLAAAQVEFDRLGRIAFASFNAFVAQGKSAVEAIGLIGPAIDDLIGASDQFGFAGSEAFESLRRWRELVANNEPLLQSLVGLNEVVTGLANIGGLTAETFADLQAQGVAAFNDLTAAGFTEQEALAQIAPFLETLIDLHKRRGLEIDEETRKLIEQAEEQGLIQANALTTNEILMSGLQGLADLFGDIFGVQVPRLFSDMVDEGRAAADGLNDAFRGLDFSLPSAGFAVPGGFTFDGPQLADGGIVRRPTIAMVGEAGPEAVIPLPDLFKSSGGGGGTVNLYVDGRFLTELIVPHMPGVVKDYGLA